MNTLSLSPLFRQSVGFDRYNDLFNSLLGSEESAPSYPPYNIERKDENHYRIVMAVAGFAPEEVDVVATANTLEISGQVVENSGDDAPQIEYLHKGIATRAFKRSFSLADHVQVQAARMENGLLVIELERVIPEEKQPRSIPILTDESSKPRLRDKRQSN